MSAEIEKQTLKKLTQEGYNTRLKKRILSNQQHLQSVKKLKGILKSRMVHHNDSSGEEDKEQNGFREYTCGCGFVTLVSSNFKKHIKQDHKGRCVEGSSHFLSPMTQFIIPCKIDLSKTKASTSNTPKVINWNGFVLIPNQYGSSLEKSPFFCGQCSCYFDKIVQFLYHCLHVCDELENMLSSHRIYDQQDWLESKFQQRSKPIHQTDIQGYQQQSDQETCWKSACQLDVPVHSQPQQPQSTEQEVVSQTLPNRATQIQIFTKTVLKASSMKSILTKSSSRKYFYDADNPNIIAIFNVTAITELRSGVQCGSCRQTFSSPYEYKIHILRSSCQQSLQSKVYLVDKALFLNKYMEYFRNRTRQFFTSMHSYKVDPMILYEDLESNENISNQTKLFLHKNRGFVMLYFDIYSKISQPFACKVCGAKNMCSINQYSHLYKMQHYSREVSVIFNRNDLKTYKTLDLDNNFLDDEIFHCPCNDIPQSKQMFIQHVLTNHKGAISFKLKF